MYQVLLVDDEPILQLGIRRMLEGAADYQICASARNGEEAQSGKRRESRFDRSPPRRRAWAAI